DVEDHEAAVPVAHVEPVALANRVMAAVVPSRPRRCLAPRRPLPRHPPAPDLQWPRRVGEVEDHDDVADVSLHLRREIPIATVEGEAVDAGAAALPERDLARARRVRHVVDPEATRHAGPRLI